MDDLSLSDMQQTVLDGNCCGGALRETDVPHV